MKALFRKYLLVAVTFFASVPWTGIVATSFITTSCTEESYSQLINNNVMLSDGQQLKKYALFIMGGQSNEGTDTTPGSEATGQVPYAQIPAYLANAPPNIKFMKVITGVPTVTTWTVNASVAWGWWNQVLHNASPIWDTILYAKRAVGGTTLLPSGGGTYNRDNFKTIANDGITAANARWGAGNYNIFVFWGLCESNGLSQSDAEDFEDALIEWFDEIRSDVTRAPIIVKKFEKYADIDFQYGVPYVQTSQVNAVAATERAYLVSGTSTAFSLQDSSNNDYSHIDPSGAITLGNYMLDKALTLIKAQKVDHTSPVLQSAVISSGTPNKIVLTYDESLNNTVKPFWKDFTTTGTVSSDRKVTSVSITGSTATLTFSENFYSGETVTLTYTKKQYYENCIQDFYGNEAVNFSSQSVTNNSSTSNPSYTSIYTSNFSSGVDSWGAVSSSCTLASVDGIDGQNDVLEVTASSTSVSCFRSVTLVNGGLYRVRVSVNVPELLQVSGSASNSYDLRLLHGTSTTIAPLYQYRRRNVVTGWDAYEFTFTAGATGQIRFQLANVTIAQKFYFVNYQLTRIQ